MIEPRTEQATNRSTAASSGQIALVVRVVAMVLVATIVLMTDGMPGISSWNAVVPAFTAFCGISSMNINKLEDARDSGRKPRWRDVFPMFLLFALYFGVFVHAAAVMHLVPIIAVALPSWPGVLQSGYAATLYMALILIPLAQIGLALELLLVHRRHTSH